MNILATSLVFHGCVLKCLWHKTILSYRVSYRISNKQRLLNVGMDNLKPPHAMVYLTPSSTLQNSYTINWNSHQSQIVEGIKQLATFGGGGDGGGEHDLFLTDVTLASCDGDYIPAHKLILSLCSSFFKELFQRNRVLEKGSSGVNTVMILGHVSGRCLRQLMEFMYQGKVDLAQEDVDTFLQAGCMLRIEGLIDSSGSGGGSDVNNGGGGVSGGDGDDEDQKPSLNFIPPPPDGANLVVPEPSSPSTSTRCNDNGTAAVPCENTVNPPKKKKAKFHPHVDSQDHSQSSSSTITGGEVESAQYCQVELDVVEANEEEKGIESTYFVGKMDPLQLFAYSSSPAPAEGGEADGPSTSSTRPPRRRRSTSLEDSGTVPTTAAVGGGPKPRHPIWNLYQYDPEVNACMCLVSGCTSTLAGKKTTNLMRHVKFFHAEEFNKLFGEQTASSSSSSNSSEHSTSRSRPL